MAYWVVKAVLTPIFRFFWRVRVEGADQIPTDGSAILASNHLAVLDSFFLPMVVRRRITFVAKAEYFEDPKTAWFFRAVGQIPIKRGGGTASQAALDTAKEVLQGGDLFGIYPEGTRSPDGRLYKGRTGVARLALDTGSPVVPVAMIGTREVNPIGAAKPNVFLPVTIRIGKPLRFDRYQDRAGDPLVLRQITDEIMFELRSLSGQEYVNAYAKRNDPEALPQAEPTPVLSGPPVPALEGVTSAAAPAAV